MHFDGFRLNIPIEIDDCDVEAAYVQLIVKKINRDIRQYIKSTAWLCATRVHDFDSVLLETMDGRLLGIKLLGGYDMDSPSEARYGNWRTNVDVTSLLKIDGIKAKLDFYLDMRNYLCKETRKQDGYDYYVFSSDDYWMATIKV